MPLSPAPLSPVSYLKTDSSEPGVPTCDRKPLEQGLAITSGTIRHTDRIIHRHRRIPGLANAELIFNPGNSLISQSPAIQAKAFEDRFSLIHGADGTVVAIALDGVGEHYTQPASRKTYPFNGTRRVLGDIPGLVLMETFSHIAQTTPSRLESFETIQGVIQDATSTYQNWLEHNHLADRLAHDKEHLGACTFAVAVVTPPRADRKRQVLLVSVGDSIGVAQTASGQIIGTENQVLTSESALTPLHRFLTQALAPLGPAQARQRAKALIFSGISKKWLRNQCINQATVEISALEHHAFIQRVSTALECFDDLGPEQRHGIACQLHHHLPRSLPGYGLFDGSPNVVNSLSMQAIPFDTINYGTLIVATDGCLAPDSPDQGGLCRRLVQTYLDHSILGLASYNQQPHRGPEATAVALKLCAPKGPCVH